MSAACHHDSCICQPLPTVKRGESVIVRHLHGAEDECHRHTDPGDMGKVRERRGAHERRDDTHDGNGAAGDGCSALCQIETCGNGTVEAINGEFVRRAPLGDPVEICVRGALLSLRETEACHIEVDLVP